MTRVAFVTQGARVPASRFRVEQMIPELARHVECSLLPSSPSVYGDLSSGRLHGGWRVFAQPLSVLSRIRQLAEIVRHDVAWLQRPMVQYGFTAFERYVANRTATVFEFDDAIFHNNWGLAAPKVRRIIDAAHHVVVGNRYLAEFVADASRTTIIPTVVDAHRYAPRPDPGGRFTIVWTGLSSNLKELAPYARVIGEVLRETRGRLVVVSDRCDASFLRQLDVEHVPWSPEIEVSALAQGHVGVMPIADSEYNRGKCGFKLIQYMARAIPVVASPVGANADIVRDGTDGFHATTPDNWKSALLELARSPALRERMGASARERVEANYSITAVLPRYLEVLSRVQT